MVDCRTTQSEALAELQRICPDAPFLALGQTVFWDEPMKAGVQMTSANLGYKRRFVAGIHDTDYFAKLPTKKASGQFKAVAHNDTTTKGLWSAAGEFSSLFGSETVITKDQLHFAGLKLAKISQAREGILDEATEAWGWRGVVYLGSEAKIPSQIELGPAFRELNSTLEWAVSCTLSCIAGDSREANEAAADRLRLLVCDAAENRKQTLAEHYRRVLPSIYNFVSGEEIPIEATQTTELLRFNTQTCSLKRFDLPRQFIDSKSRAIACQCYNEAVAGSEIYGLDRFGVGAIPFDLVVPGHGRGTIRLGTKGVVISTHVPLFLSFKKPLTSIEELAAAVEKKFGPDCALIGKAVTLIGMLATEFVFVFHEGASGYVGRSRSLHNCLVENGLPTNVNPILRVKYSVWDSVSASCPWFKLPDPLKRPFGLEEICGPSFSARWRGVVAEQKSLLKRLGELKSPFDLLRFYCETFGDSWEAQAQEYRAIHGQLEQLNVEISELRRMKQMISDSLKALGARRLETERAMGQHWRAKIFEKDASQEDLEKREEFKASLEALTAEKSETRSKWQDLQTEQSELVKKPAVLAAHERRRNIELELELKRLSLIREAVIASDGLNRSNTRPSAWWMPIVCPSGAWFKKTVEAAEYSLEPLIG